MSKQNDTINARGFTQFDIDRAIDHAHRLRADETRRLARVVGRRVRAIFGH